jgi:hypothetical protein
MTTERMPDPLSRFVKDFPEMYEVVRTVVVVRHRRLYKVEVLKDQTALARFKGPLLSPRETCRRTN